MKKYLTLMANQKNKQHDYEIKGESFKDVKKVVDDSYFTPTSELVKRLSSSRPLSEQEIKSMYDFYDGKDNGMKVPISRRADIKDIAELSVEINQSKDDLNKNIESAKEDIEFNQKLNNITNNNVSSGSTESVE